jgi:hypothetical protein
MESLVSDIKNMPQKKQYNQQALNFRGCRVNSRRLIPVKPDFSHTDHTFYEGNITKLFSPWLVKNIPDPTWQTLTKKLGFLVREMLSKRNIGGST